MSTHAQREEIARELREIEHASLALLKRVNVARAANDPPLTLLQLPARIELSEIPGTDEPIASSARELRARLTDYVDGAERLTAGLHDVEIAQEVRAGADILRGRVARLFPSDDDVSTTPAAVAEPVIAPRVIVPPAVVATPAPAPDPMLPPPPGQRTVANVAAWLKVVRPKRKVVAADGSITVWTSSTKGWTYDDTAGFDDLVSDVLTARI